MVDHCINDLKRLQDLLFSLNIEQYKKPSEWLSQATIGQHIRHILEFYTCLMEGTETEWVNYDNRKRDIKIENDQHTAIHTIDEIINKLKEYNTPYYTDFPLVHKGDYSYHTSRKECFSASSLGRELAYCLEHSIHHQALIKVSLKEQALAYLIDDTFGIAPATVRNNHYTIN